MGESQNHPIAAVVDAAPDLGARLCVPTASGEEAETVAMLIDSVRSWAERSIDSAAIDEAAHVDRSIYRSAAELGLFGLTIPSQYGGAGFSLSAAARITEEIATFDRSVATGIGLHCGLGLRGLIAFGSDDLKQEYLPRLATGERIAAFAATEPDAGSHIAGIKTTGRWDEAKDQLTVNGSKIWVTNGGIADVYTILAKTPGLAGARRGYSILLLDRGMPGLEVGAEEHKLGIKGSSTTTLAFDDLVVSTDRVLGEPSKGLDQMQEILAWGRTLMTAGALGTARAAYEQAVRWVLERRQFGKPIAAFGIVREKMALMRARLYAVESLVRMTTLLQSAYGSDIIWESSVAKVFATESSWLVIDDALQVHGGAGYIEETGIARILRDSRITRIFEGANEVLRFHISAASLGMAAELAALPVLRVPEQLADEAARFDRLAKRTADGIRDLRDRFGLRLAEHQLLMGKSADAIIGLFTLLAVLLRTSGELERGDGNEQALRVGRYAATLLEREAEASLAALERIGEEALVVELTDAEYERVRSRS
jgi:alkylation response protein AidB-like acyl-CoA dehydrogenase